MSWRDRNGLSHSNTTSERDLLWILLVGFLFIIFAMMAQEMQKEAEEKMIEQVEEIIKRSPEELHAHFTWIPYKLDNASQGIVVGGKVIAGQQLEAILNNFHITLFRDGFTAEQEPDWWKAKLSRQPWNREKSTSHEPTKGFDDEDMYSPLKIRFHGTMPTDQSTIDKIQKIKLSVQYEIRGGQVFIGGTPFPQDQIDAMLSQTQGLFIYLRQGDELDPEWLKSLWRKYHFADFDKFEDLWKKK